MNVRQTGSGHRLRPYRRECNGNAQRTNAPVDTAKSNNSSRSRRQRRRHPHKLLSSFAFALRRRRTELGPMQEKLAHRAGVSMRYISLLETQKHQPRLDAIKGLSEGLETTMVALVSEIEDLLREG
ncbi:helix-turn-helix domain-containing protein [Cognatiyoonia sp. IB215446]|uniref:helix-turn-helix domain-containing protein n=1 Tax=Cognatiyoonia sp. IB215446 TaxID=3097355 RepID=UPI002A13C45F|nr:helix-turn-helix domain-containing protein [Cognatiyoonia sp. IB215446]MDX8347903.1 helix-turn-helix domain-containing protein [Cognatiyoonia sp. IB215446]